MSEVLIPSALTDQEQRMLEVLRGGIAMVNAHDFSNAAEFFVDDLVLHAPDGTTEYTRDAGMAALRVGHENFSDFRIEPQQFVISGNLASIRFVTSGRGDREFNGFPPTGRTFAVRQCNFYVFTEEPRVKEIWITVDLLGIMRELGLLPDGPPPKLILKLMALQQRRKRKG